MCFLLRKTHIAKTGLVTTYITSINVNIINLHFINPTPYETLTNNLNLKLLLDT